MNAPRRTLIEPRVGWQRGLELLVLEGRCPWCAERVEGLDVQQVDLGGTIYHVPGSSGLTWSCAEGCNP